MATVTRRIGLSLGADICWPICYEDIVAELDLELPIGRDQVRFAVDRVSIEPFNLRRSVPYDVVLDRLTHWYHPSREWIKKAVIMDGVYVFNNPWSVQSMEKQTSCCAMMQLGLPIPKTALIPPKEYEHRPDLQATLRNYAKLFDLDAVGADIGYPAFLKPYDGGGWVGVSKIDSADELKQRYDESGKFVMHLQQGIVPYEKFVRAIGLGPQVKIVEYDPSAPLHQRYKPGEDVVSDDDRGVLEDIALTINAFFGWDFNSSESLLREGTWYPIDFANPCPDSQVTSLHEHFPWVVLANIRWSLFCAATKRRFRQNLNWEPFYRIARKQPAYRDALREYAKLAAKHFDTARFTEFCGEHLADLDRVAHAYFGEDRARNAVRKKVEALFPKHEWDEFTERFWQSIQTWRQRQTNPGAV